MDGYVASARIAGVAPRLAAASLLTREPTEPHANRPDDAVAVMIEADGWSTATPRSSFGERWAAARARWTQLTFYLFDANSWR